MDPRRGGRRGVAPLIDELAIRRATPEDGPGIGDVWLSAWRATFDFPPGHPDDDVRRWLADELVPTTEAWVAAEPGGRVVALMALSDTMVEQLYVAPDWIGRGLGTRLLDFAKARRPAGLDLYCFQANPRARRFYEQHGFRAIAEGDGSGNEERQPDIRYAWRPTPAAPSLVVPSRDGTPVAVFDTGRDGAPPLLLVHGTTADHTAFRALGPGLADAFSLHAIDRRGRGASGDTLPYGIEREFEDVAVVAEAVAARVGVPAVDVFGHSYGGRCALGAALRTDAIRRVISYEGAPSPPGSSYQPAGLDEDLASLLAASDLDGLLETFMRRVVGMTEADLAAYRANPVWPLRVAAAPTIVRELAAEADPVASLDALGGVRQPVLQILGGASLPAFRDATTALDARLPDGRVVEITGARHAAHHTHVDAVVAATLAFLQPDR